MITSIVIVFLSTAMFAYCCLYLCLFILAARRGEEKANASTGSQKLSFVQLEVQLAQARTAIDLDRVRKSLDRDLQVLQAMTQSSSELQVGGASLESRLHMIDYRMMQVCFAGPKAQDALREMSQIVAYLAAESGTRLTAAEI